MYIYILYHTITAEHIAMQGACVVLSGRADRSFVTHRGSTAEFCREDIDVRRLLDSSHVHVGTEAHVGSSVEYVLIKREMPNGTYAAAIRGPQEYCES